MDSNDELLTEGEREERGIVHAGTVAKSRGVQGWVKGFRISDCASVAGRDVRPQPSDRQTNATPRAAMRMNAFQSVTNTQARNAPSGTGGCPPGAVNGSPRPASIVNDRAASNG